MTDQSSDAGSSGGTSLELTWSHLMDLLNASASRTIYFQAAEMLDDIELTDDEIDALLKLPVTYRQKVTASFLDYAESIREASRNLDAQLMRLTGELV